jgi:hypothetical protein
VVVVAAAVTGGTAKAGGGSSGGGGPVRRNGEIKYDQKPKNKTKKPSPTTRMRGAGRKGAMRAVHN